MASRLDLTIGISDAIGLDAHLTTAVSVQLPEVAPPNGSPPVLFAFPGGAYGRSHYDLQPPGRAGYSFAERRRDRGALRAAQQIDVPLFPRFGSRDVATIPRREPRYYPLATDITTFVLPKAGHCRNHAPGRRRFFDRLAARGKDVARVRTAPAQEAI